MMFSKACEYSIRATIFIAMQSEEGKRTNLKEIARTIASPEAFTAKLLQELVKNDIIRSVQGVMGGFEIPKNRIGQIKLCQIVDAIDGDSIYKVCGLGLKDCSEVSPCPLHSQFKVVRQDLKNMLENTHLGDLTTDLKNGKTTLKIESFLLPQ